MKFLRNLTVGGKIISILVFMIFLQAAIALVGIYFLNNMSRNINTIVTVQSRKIELAAQVDRGLLEIRRAEKSILMADTGQEVNKYAREISDQKRAVEDALAKMTPLVDDKGATLVSRFRMNYQDFLKVNDTIISTMVKEAAALPDSHLPSAPESATLLNHEMMTLSQDEGRKTYDAAAADMAALTDKVNGDMAAAKAASDRNVSNALSIMIVMSLASIGLGLVIGLAVSRSITSGLNGIVTVADAIAGGDLATPVEIRSADEVGALADSVSRMQTSLRSAREESEQQDWLKSGIMRLNSVMLGEVDMAALTNKIVSEMATHLDVQAAAFFVAGDRDKDRILTLTSSYAYTKRKNLSNQFAFGEGLVGQAALENKQILISNIPDDYIKVTSGLGEAAPQFIAVTPVVYENRLKGVIECATLGKLSGVHMEYLKQAAENVAINIETVQSRGALARALEESQTLSEELQVQQEELKAANEELEEQTQLLQASEEKLRVQQEELEVTNEELEEKNASLQRQKQDIEQARREVERKAEELSIASKYKSEFLANMSHELRTPLNSLLLLSRMLSDNKTGNLTEEQVESAAVIYKSGNDLLSLINEILDLSKIEAGRMDIDNENITMAALSEGIHSSFAHMAQEKGLELDISVGGQAPPVIFTDRKRLEQILRNLLSNAIKFTEKGRVSVTMDKAPAGANLSRSGLSVGDTLAITVRDTGIGIPADKQKIVFEAFQQVEGGTTRKYGGTGLGLSISRELAHLLGGEIQLTSEPGKGSVFTLFLPLGRTRTAADPPAGAPPAPPVFKAPDPALPPPAVERISDDRDALRDSDKTILVVEDDAKFAKLLMAQCHEKGFRCLAAPTGEEGLALAEQHLPAAVILDIKLPGMDGWAVLELLKENPRTRHIPVHLASIEESSIDAFRKGAVGYLTKPAVREDIDAAFLRLEAIFNRSIKDLLVVEDNDAMRRGIVQLIGNGDVHSDEAATGEQALAALAAKPYDCMILDLGLPDMTGFELLKRLEARDGVIIPPVIVYTGRDLTREEETELRAYAESIIIKGVRSEERLLDETSLFLHRVVGNFPEKKRRIIADLHNADSMFRDKRILIVDDDMRNAFAISRVLEEKGMKVIKAEDGSKALEVLRIEPAVDLVLMDIMMPVMDGYETMKRIRSMPHFMKLPIIALTAKAMREDREHCLEAGASDYLPKPVDVNRLFSMMRVWLYR